METSLLLAILLTFTGLSVTAGGQTEQPSRQVRLRQTLLELSKNSTLQTAFAARAASLQQTSSCAGQSSSCGEDFPCTPIPRSSTRPTSVHQLRPGDIDVVAAMGDSLTAGSGITAATILGVLREERGLAWSIGGEGDFKDQPTLPNILKKYNPSLKGFSTGPGDVDSKHAHLNVAETGFESVEIEGEARKLIDRMRADPNIDFENDWKLITILIGDNDLCEICNDKETYSAERYIERVTKALDILHAEVPRAFVNLVEILNIEIVTELNKGLVCSVLHFALCRCAAFPKDGAALEELRAATKAYQGAAYNLAVSGRYDTRPDFTVVDQPFFRETYLPKKDGKADLSYFAPDCFHLSRRGQAAAAEALWNSMIEPPRTKKLVWTPGEQIECPTEESPYFFTYNNNRSHVGNAQSHVDPMVPSLQNAWEHGKAPEQSGSSPGLVVLAVGLTALAVAMVTVLAVVIARRRRRAYVTLL